jgi:predicted nuclease with TOPRIM domain
MTPEVQKQLEDTIQRLEIEKQALSEANEELTDENAALKSGVAELERKVAALSKTGSSVKIETRERSIAPVVGKETFEVRGKQYKFKLPAFWLGNQKMTAADALKSDEILAMIVEKYPSLVETA